MTCSKSVSGFVVLLVQLESEEVTDIGGSGGGGKVVDIDDGSCATVFLLISACR